MVMYNGWQVKEEDFSFKHRQPYFVFFLLNNNFKVGMNYKVYEFSIWIREQYTNFQRTVGQKWKNRHGILKERTYQNEFLNWLYAKYRR